VVLAAGRFLRRVDLSPLHAKPHVLLNIPKLLLLLCRKKVSALLVHAINECASLFGGGQAQVMIPLRGLFDYGFYLCALLVTQFERAVESAKVVMHKLLGHAATLHPLIGLAGGNDKASSSSGDSTSDKDSHNEENCLEREWGIHVWP
jgi:hypothetical protein